MVHGQLRHQLQIIRWRAVQATLPLQITRRNKQSYNTLFASVDFQFVEINFKNWINIRFSDQPQPSKY